MSLVLHLVVPAVLDVTLVQDGRRAVDQLLAVVAADAFAIGCQALERQDGQPMANAQDKRMAPGTMTKPGLDGMACSMAEPAYPHLDRKEPLASRLDDNADSTLKWLTASMAWVSLRCIFRVGFFWSSSPAAVASRL